MSDKEKVLVGLKSCYSLECGNKCPYFEYSYLCQQHLLQDALALLKEQDELLRKKQKDIDRLCNEVSEWKHKFHDTPKEQKEVSE